MRPWTGSVRDPGRPPARRADGQTAQANTRPPPVMGGAALGSGLRLIDPPAHRTTPGEKLWTRKPADGDGRRVWPGNPRYVRLSTMVAGSVPAKRPGTAAFARRGVMAPGLLEREWWWGQSRANPSPPNSLSSGTGNSFGRTENLIRGTGNYLVDQGTALRSAAASNQRPATAINC